MKDGDWEIYSDYETVAHMYIQRANNEDAEPHELRSTA